MRTGPRSCLWNCEKRLVRWTVTAGSMPDPWENHRSALFETCSRRTDESDVEGFSRIVLPLPGGPWYVIHARRRQISIIRPLLGYYLQDNPSHDRSSPKERSFREERRRILFFFSPFLALTFARSLSHTHSLSISIGFLSRLFCLYRSRGLGTYLGVEDLASRHNTDANLRTNGFIETPSRSLDRDGRAEWSTYTRTSPETSRTRSRREQRLEKEEEERKMKEEKKEKTSRHTEQCNNVIRNIAASRLSPVTLHSASGRSSMTIEQPNPWCVCDAYLPPCRRSVIYILIIILLMLHRSSVSRRVFEHRARRFSLVLDSVRIKRKWSRYLCVGTTDLEIVSHPATSVRSLVDGYETKRGAADDQVLVRR